MNILVLSTISDQGYASAIKGRLEQTKYKVKLDFSTRYDQSSSLFSPIPDVVILVVSNSIYSNEQYLLRSGDIVMQCILKTKPRLVIVRLDQTIGLSFFSKFPEVFVSKKSIATSPEEEEINDELLVTDEELDSIIAKIRNLGRRIQNPSSPVRPYCDFFRKQLSCGRLTLVCGAGISIQAGIPKWSDLLADLSDKLIENTSKKHSKELGFTAKKEINQRYGSSPLIFAKYLKDNFGKTFIRELRSALYRTTSDNSELLDSIVNVARARRSGAKLDSIITFNFDCLIEEFLEKNSIDYKSIHSEVTDHEPEEIPIYHVHGFLPRNEIFGEKPGLVFSEDAYHTQFIDSFSWSNLVQLTKFNETTCIFIGISLTDPNLRRLLDISRRKKKGSGVEHYIIKKVPAMSKKNKSLQILLQIMEERDAISLGINTIWINDYKEIPEILNCI
jgi:hypothetical protein